MEDRKGGKGISRKRAWKETCLMNVDAIVFYYQNNRCIQNRKQKSV